jgi:dTDP-4-dehydrorhamnose 3,5-epimerase
MIFKETKLKGCFIIEPALFNDARGLFYECYQKDKFENQLGKKVDFVQDNVSISKKGVLRGLHFQTRIHAQAKLVQVIKGEALDVVVDLRKESPSYGDHFKIRLTENDNKLLFIPKGMAHGFLALEDDTVFVYKCDNYYNKASEAGIIYNDIDLGVDWEYPSERILLSEKDQQLSTFKALYS